MYILSIEIKNNCLFVTLVYKYESAEKSLKFVNYKDFSTVGIRREKVRLCTKIAEFLQRKTAKLQSHTNVRVIHKKIINLFYGAGSVKNEVFACRLANLVRLLLKLQKAHKLQAKPHLIIG